MRLYGIRGAVCCENTVEDIKINVGEMCGKIFSENGLKSENIVSVQFTVTPDLTALNPAAALRRSGIDFDVSSLALFCSAEPVVEKSLPRTIRVLVTAYMDEEKERCHIYLNGAEVLRPDFVRK